MSIFDPLVLGPRTARNRVFFGPHETNLGRDRAISERHVAYYRRRAAGGTGVVVTEEASVHESDWPYERCPLWSASQPGWAAVANACHGEGSLVLAALGHAGGQGSSAYSQAPLWAPSRLPDVNTREVPKWMEASDIEAVVHGFAAAAAAAVASGVDGVEVNAGQWSLVRQFLSGLTNQRDDEWGQDKLRFARAVLAAVRAGVGADAVVGLRLSCDEYAPWAGMTPEAAVEVAAALAGDVDYITVVSGSIYTAQMHRPDTHVEPGFNLGLARAVRAAVPPTVAVVAQGSIVDIGQAEWALGDGVCDAVEMTRAQIADAELVGKVQTGITPRPCIRCNQTCQVRDNRNPIVTCVGDPRSGHELDDAPEVGLAPNPLDLTVVGGGVAGLECARVAAGRGHRVTLLERSDQLGGALRVASAGAGRAPLVALADWLEAECRRLGVQFETGREVRADEVATPVVLCTGSLTGLRRWGIEDGAVVLTAAEVLGGVPLPDGAIAVWDPIGGPIGISVAERLRAEGRDVVLVTTDLIPGNELARTGDLAPANTRLQTAGVALATRTMLRRVVAGGVEVEDRFTGEARTIAAVALVDAGSRFPDDALWRATGERLPRAGDAVAPRSIHEAVLEGRRQAMAVEASA